MCVTWPAWTVAGIIKTTVRKANVKVIVTQSCPALRPRGLYIIRLFCPWDSPDKNTGADCHFLLQGIFLIQESNLRLLRLLNWQMDSLPLCHLGSPFF